MKTIAMNLEDYEKSHGDFPDRIAEALRPNFQIANDGWGNPYHYEHRPGCFILVSYGSDEKPDGIDYWALREQNSNEDIDGKFKADHLISDRGWHRVGGK